jgi:hypothetical protein
MLRRCAPRLCATAELRSMIEKMDAKMDHRFQQFDTKFTQLNAHIEDIDKRWEERLNRAEVRSKNEFHKHFQFLGRVMFPVTAFLITSIAYVFDMSSKDRIHHVEKHHQLALEMSRHREATGREVVSAASKASAACELMGGMLSASGVEVRAPTPPNPQGSK